jgi:phosphoribosylformimino-5-aminoimidazole carboxamide ribotide isomerase
MQENIFSRGNDSPTTPLGTRGLEIIAAIDIIEGKCVRLTKGDYSQKKIYNENPFEVAKEFEAAGIKRLHLVDLDGAKEGTVKNWKTLETIASGTSLIIDFSGGIKTENDVQLVFNSGASITAVGSIAVKNKNEFLRWTVKFGKDKFLLGADVSDNKIIVQGWTETTDIKIDDFIEGYLHEGVNQVFCTDVSKDGMLEGPAISLYRHLIKKFPELQLIASGGISSLTELEELKNIGCKGAIIGKALYEGKITLKELKPYLPSYAAN